MRVKERIQADKDKVRASSLASFPAAHLVAALGAWLPVSPPAA